MEAFPEETLTVTDRAFAAVRAAGSGPFRSPERRRRVLDAYSRSRLEGAATDIDTEKETKGFRHDHPDAAFAALR